MSLRTPNKTHPVATLTERTVLAAWLERYAHQQQGNLPYETVSNPRAFPKNSVDEIRSSLTGLVLVEAYPGVHGEGIVAALSKENPLGLDISSFSAVRRLNVKIGELGQSGIVAARMVIRLIEEALDETIGSRDSSSASLVKANGPLQQALFDLSKRGKRVLFGIESLHNGIEPYRGEPLTVYDVYKMLAGSPVTVVATVVPGAINRPLFDRKIQVDIPETPEIEPVQFWVRRLTEQQPLNYRILKCLARRPKSDLFGICDALEEGGQPTVFEPAVERALWDLRPLLKWERVTGKDDSGTVVRKRVWTLYSPAVKQVMDSMGIKK